MHFSIHVYSVLQRHLDEKSSERVEMDRLLIFSRATKLYFFKTRASAQRLIVVINVSLIDTLTTCQCVNASRVVSSPEVESWTFPRAKPQIFGSVWFWDGARSRWCGGRIVEIILNAINFQARRQWPTMSAWSMPCARVPRTSLVFRNPIFNPPSLAFRPISGPFIVECIRFIVLLFYRNVLAPNAGAF